MTTLFISDLHLSDQSPELVQAFLDFISQKASHATQLYILGDLFEAWVGDDDPSETARRVSEALYALSQRGCHIQYMHGNRDFLLGENYAKRCGMHILQDPYTVVLDTHRLLLSHGDIFCTDDLAYQRYRTIVQKPWVQHLFLRVLPRIVREKIAMFLRQRSQAAGQTKSLYIMDVNAETIAKAMETARATVLIHGHTHRPQTHVMPGYTRYVLGAWDVKPVYLEYDGTFALREL